LATMRGGRTEEGRGGSGALGQALWSVAVGGLLRTHIYFAYFPVSGKTRCSSADFCSLRSLLKYLKTPANQLRRPLTARWRPSVLTTQRSRTLVSRFEIRTPLQLHLKLLYIHRRCRKHATLLIVILGIRSQFVAPPTTVVPALLSRYWLVCA
jgi:hypothetical protein